MQVKELWLKNNSGSDVNLSDLGVKVPKDKTINVFKSNPYITAAQVQKSLESGSVFKRLSNKTLEVVVGYSNPTPPTLNHIGLSSNSIEIVKSKSSIIINNKDMDILSDEDLGDFADYGFDPDVNLNSSRSKTNEGAVVVEQKQDDQPPKELKKPIQKPTSVEKSEENTVVVKQDMPVEEKVEVYDSKVATKDKSGTIVMKFKETK